MIKPVANSGSFLKLAIGPALKEWDKLKVLDELWEPDALHKPTLFFMEMADLDLQASNATVAALTDDFRDLIGPAGIVVRTSVRAGAEKIPNLPRTECLKPDAAARWCMDMVQALGKDHQLSGLAFVAHRFVAARASAWARAEPGVPTVEINSLWGLPDALQYCPYDIWEVHVPTTTAIDYPDYKSDMLISQPDGSWEYVRVKNELARANSIGINEAKDIATRSASIAQRLGRACHIMWFVGCAQREGPAFNIPWYWTEAHPSQKNLDRSTYRVFTVSNRKSLADFIKWTGSRTRQALALRPTDLELMRDTEFIVEVGTAAKEAEVPVVLSGSTLAHAYYQLRKLGCTVVTPSEKDHSRIRRSATLGKLVRDKIPSKIAQRQEVEITRRIPENLKKSFLVGKLFEEGIEVREAVGVDQKTEELADVLEVLRALAEAEGLSMSVISKVADQKKRKSGGFAEGLVLLQTAIATSDHSLMADLGRNVGDVLISQSGDDAAEIPFSFFGFMELDRRCSVHFEELGIRMDIVLRSDRLELQLVRRSEQLEFQFEELSEI